MGGRYHCIIPRKDAQPVCRQRGARRCCQLYAMAWVLLRRCHFGDDLLAKGQASWKQEKMLRTSSVESGECLHLGYMQDLFAHFDGTPTHSLAVLSNAD